MYRDQPIANILPLDLFDDFSGECNRLALLMEKKRIKDDSEMKVSVAVQDKAGNQYSIKGYALDYLEDLQEFIIEINGVRHLVGRLRIQFEEFETKEQAETRRGMALQLQQETFHRLNMERIFFNEVLKLHPNLRQPSKTTVNI